MSILFGDSIDLTLQEVQNASFQKLAADPGSPVTGQFWFLTTSQRLKIRTSSASEIVPFLGSSNANALSVGDLGQAGSSLYASREDHEHPLPGVATSGVSGFMSGSDKTKMDAATSAPTASTLVIRDTNGRFQAADPAAGADVTTYAWVTAQIALAKQGLAWKLPVRTIFTTNLAGTYVAGTKRLTASANGILASNDGVTSWAVGHRLALNGQTTASQNGIYDVIDPGTAGTPWILERSADFGGPGSVAGDIYSGAFFIVREGTEYGDTSWVCSNDTVTIDTTAITFQQDVKAAVDNSTIEVNGSGNLQVKDAGVTYAKFQNLPACSLFGRAANSTGVGGAISAASDNLVLVRSGGSLQFLSVSNAMLATMAAKSVKANATNASAVPTDLAATAADQVLQVNSGNTGLEWGTIRTAGITAKAVTYAKVQDVSAQYRILGRISSGAGVIEELTPSNVRAMLVSDIAAGAAMKAVQYTIGDGTTTNITITHNLGSQNIVGVFLRRVSDQARFEAGWTAPTSSTVALTFGSAPALNSLVATILYV